MICEGCVEVSDDAVYDLFFDAFHADFTIKQFLFGNNRLFLGVLKNSRWL